jgi:transposase
MQPQIDDEAVFAEEVREVVEVHQAAQGLRSAGVRVVSCDEKTGMQAIERHGQWAMKPGRPERQEAWYTRHGTLSLTANLDLATGEVVAPTMAKTRTNADFVAHVANTVATSPESGWVFVVDNLNTHTSAELVAWVAAKCGISEDLGEKGVRGQLRDRHSRASFLRTVSHRIRFIYTPKHCSWLNEIERWFSKLSRSVLRRGSFTGLDALRVRVMDYITHYNAVDAKPHRWKISYQDLMAKFRIAT